MAAETTEKSSGKRISGSYSASLLGTIRSHLEGLQGYDVMALELIQNADDAKAGELAFDVTDEGLWVRNSGRFSYCGELAVKPCPKKVADGESCDFHRITEVASGGKLARGENIGRFGIGFVSTYQVTDHPEIFSSGIKLTLRPEEEEWFIEPIADEDGTAFFLPWATDLESPARLALGLSHVNKSHIDKVATDIQDVLSRSLLFLRHVTKAEVRRNGRLLLGAELDRGDGSGLKLTFTPGGRQERWIILRTDAKEAASKLYHDYPRLEALDRDTKISVGLRVEPESLDDGLIYAFLPTEQSTGLPIHINADFFPEGDRKAVIFAGEQHQKAWNEMLIEAAAAELARYPERLANAIGFSQLWRIFLRAFEMSKPQRQHPACFDRFWMRIKATAISARIVPTQDGAFHVPSSVLLPRSPLSASQVGAMQKLGGKVASEELRTYQNAMTALGINILTFDRLIALMESGLASRSAGEEEIGEEECESLFHPLWSLANDLIPDAVDSPQAKLSIQKLKALPFVVTEDSYLVTIGQSCIAPETVKAGRAAELLPRMAILSRKLRSFQKMCALGDALTLRSVAAYLNNHIRGGGTVEDAIATGKEDLRDLYTLFAELDRNNTSDSESYDLLRKLPIWLSSHGLVRADQALLPGDFADPTGQADLIDASILTDASRAFMRDKLGVESQTAKAFVQNVLPRYFDENGPVDPQRYPRLINDLANHPALIDEDATWQILAGFPIVPTQDGGWALPENAYWKSDDLARVLGNAKHLWADMARIPNSRSVVSFLDGLGVRKTPAAEHLVERMIGIAESSPPDDNAKRASEEAFYALCDIYKSPDEDETLPESVSSLLKSKCFPAENDRDNWHASSSLYNHFRADAFRSQAFILDFKTTIRLSTGLLDDLGIKTNPKTNMVVEHLLHCVESGTEPNSLVYQVLNERAGDPELVRLKGTRCIWIDSLKTFVRPNQLYWTPQQLGRYAFTIPGRFESFRPFFKAIDVKDAPEGADFADILLDITGGHYERCKPLEGADRAIYDSCLRGIADAVDADALDDEQLERLSKSPSMLNTFGSPSFPDEVLLPNSVWHADFFQGELDKTLCNCPDTSLWPILEEIGVGRLSDHAKIELDYTDGEKRGEPEFGQRISDRADILARYLHDKPPRMRAKIREAANELSVFSYDRVRIQAIVHLGKNELRAPTAQALAHYDAALRHLILARPVTERSWLPALSAIFHQVMPEESGGEISRLALGLRSLMLMPVDEAHRELNDANMPFLDAKENDEGVDLTSPQLGEIGAETTDEVSPNQVADGKNEAGASTTESPLNEPVVVPTAGAEGKASSGIDAGEKVDGDASSTMGGLPTADKHGSAGGRSHGTERRDGEKRGGTRPEHKKQWDRRLLSHVRRKEEGESGDGENLSEHNLAVEAVARDAVDSYERDRGRNPEQMPITHPGYDIISTDVVTGECRYIEVKGVSGQWNQAGVSVSRLQFSNAQDYGDSYWLYVVEFISDPEHIRIHPIQNPAGQVTNFIFDGGWRDAASVEVADPSLRFVVGAKIIHQSFGPGRILSVELKGSSRLMSIDFEKSGERPVTLNLHSMHIVEDDENGPDAS